MKRKNYAVNLSESLSSIQVPTIIETRKYQQKIQQLLQELNQSNKKNQEYRKLIDILTADRDYYQQELKRVQHSKMLFQQAINKYNIEMESKGFLIAQLKKQKRNLEEENQQLREKLEEENFMFNAQEQLLQRISKEKQIIQAEWNRELRNVKKKMVTLHKRQDQEDKENMQLFANLPLEHRVKRAIKKLDSQINNSHDEKFLVSMDIDPKQQPSSTDNENCSIFSM